MELLIEIEFFAKDHPFVQIHLIFLSGYFGECTVIVITLLAKLVKSHF